LEHNAAAAKSDSITPEKMYDVLQAGIKDTDDISFKLLGLVPLVNGAALLTAVVGIGSAHPPAIITLSLFGAIVTLGLFWWELRNIRYCLWYIELARHFEAAPLARAGVPERLRKRPAAPGNVGKRRAEKLIYATVIVSWLLLPVMLLHRTALREDAWQVYGLGAIGVAAGAIWAVLTEVDLPKG
jgi:hypothetical protein